MKINFNNWSQSPQRGTFEISAVYTIPKEILEKVYIEFSSNTPELEEYITLNKQTLELIQKKKILLAKIKQDFSDFNKDRYPELYL